MNGAKSSTATATTATAEVSVDRPLGRPVNRQAGRFAPSPTGSLHLGSLLAAAGSYLSARSAGLDWLLRFEDLDTPRVVAGSADSILRSLEALGFEWSAAPSWQSRQLERYEAALGELQHAGFTFFCTCSRRDIRLAGAALEPACVGDCAQIPRGNDHGSIRYALPTSLRDQCIEYVDGLQGRQRFDAALFRDVVIRRRDGIYAYQLAVIVDDLADGVAEVVRGADLLASTPWQRAIALCLQREPPAYTHLPVLLDAAARKLSKSAGDSNTRLAEPSQALAEILRLLRQDLPPDIGRWPVAEIWPWAIANWLPARLRGILEIPAVA